METNNYTTNLQLVSQEYSDEKTSLQTKTKKLLEYFSPKDIWKIKGLIVAYLVACFLSIMIALVLTVFAASQLSQVLPAFGQLWQQFFQTLATLLDFTITFKDNGLLFSRLITSIPLAQDFLLNLLQPIWQKKSYLVKNDLKAVLNQPVSFQK